MTSLTEKRFSTKVPETSQGTSESTLSVATSTTASSAEIVSPSSFNQAVKVASVTLSPMEGSLSKNFPMSNPFFKARQMYQIYKRPPIATRSLRREYAVKYYALGSLHRCIPIHLPREYRAQW